MANVSLAVCWNGKRLIITDDSPDVTKQRRHALLLHLAGPDVQDIFSSLLDTGEAMEYDKAVEALNAYFQHLVNTALARHTFQKLHQKPGEAVLQFATCLRQAVRDSGYRGDSATQIMRRVVD